MSQAYTKYNGKTALKTKLDVKYPKNFAQAKVNGSTSASIGWAPSGKGKCDYNVVAIYNDDDFAGAKYITYAFAFHDGQPVALIVGRVDALDHRSPLNSHRINSWNALARLVFAKGGIKDAGEILGILGIDKRLRAQAASAGHDYAAEVVLFVLDPAARGHGLGRRMFETLMDAFRLAGVRDYFLFTDTTCDVGFYVHRGLTQVCEQSLPASVPGENPSSFYLYEGSVPEPA